MSQNYKDKPLPTMTHRTLDFYGNQGCADKYSMDIRNAQRITQPGYSSLKIAGLRINEEGIPYSHGSLLIGPETTRIRVPCGAYGIEPGVLGVVVVYKSEPFASREPWADLMSRSGSVWAVPVVSGTWSE